jgi:DNA-binding MarR family transcriptional regulator
LKRRFKVTTQHARITLEEAKDLYRMGVINITTLVFLYFRIRLADGRDILDVGETCEELGIGKASFYRAIAKLKQNELISYKFDRHIVCKKAGEN